MRKPPRLRLPPGWPSSAAWVPASRRSGLFAALHQPGIARVVLTEPASDVAIAITQCPQVTAITLTEELATDD